MTTTVVVKQNIQGNDHPSSIILKYRGENFVTSFDTLIEKLEIILEKHRSDTDILSTELYDWGSKAITLIDLEVCEKKLQQFAFSHLKDLEGLLVSTQIDIMACEAKLPIELKVHKFAQNMLTWMYEARSLLDYTPTSEVSLSLQKVNLSLLPPQIAIQMYQHLKNNQQKIEAARRERSQVQSIPSASSPSLASIKRSLLKELRETKAEMLQKITDLEELTALKISVIEERQRIEKEILEFRLKNCENAMEQAQIQLTSAEQQNTAHAKKILVLNSEIQVVKNRVTELERSLNESGGCTLL